jgi:transcription termination factor Rho
LSDSTLAELHGRARDLGVPGYRKLTRSELIEEIEKAAEAPEGESAEEAPPKPEGRRRRGRRGRRGRGRENGREAAAEPEPSDEEERPAAEEVETEEVTGVLDRMPQGYGFLRLQGLRSAEGDVYVSASQIKRCELRPGDEVSGPARAPQRGERHRALIRVGSVNGQDPESDRVQFEDLTPVAPHRRVALQGSGQDPLVRAVDLLGPLALGQRVLILAEPRSGRTTLLRALGEALSRGETKVVVLLADERPEEVTAWEGALPGAEIIAAPADTEPREQVRAAELAVGHARRRAEAGEDVVILIDSLSRLALGYRDPARVKRLFGAGRELGEEGAGSLTVMATVLDSDDVGEQVRAAVETTENLLLRLDPNLAAAGVVPALVPAECRASGEEELREPEEMEKVRALRASLSEMEPEEAARALGERIADTASNEELLARL